MASIESNMQHATESDYPTIIEVLRERSQRLATRLQQTQLEMSAAGQQSSATDHPLIEQKANQFMASYVAQQRSMPMLNHAAVTPTGPAAATTAPTSTSIITRPLLNHNNHAFPIQMSMPMFQMPMPSYMPVQMQLPFANGSPVAQPPPHSSSTPLESKRAPKSRQTLASEVDALRELVHKLSNLYPDVKKYAQQLINQNEVLVQLDGLNLGDPGGPNYYISSALRPHTPAASPMPGMPFQVSCRIEAGMDPNNSHQQQKRQQRLQQQKIYQQQQRHQHQMQWRSPPPQVVDEMSRLRRESEMSSASSSSAAAQQAESPRKRNRNRKKRNDKNSSRSQNTELELMREYINSIVLQHVGGEQLLPQELLFKGDFGDLEAHARRLVSAGYGRIVEDEIRVNRKNNRQAFVSMSSDREALDRDGIVLLPVGRRYAFEGDVVRAFVLNVGAAVTKITDPNPGGITGGKTSLSLADDEAEDSDTLDSEDDNVAVTAQDKAPRAFVISIVKQTELRQIVGNISFTNPTKLCDEELFYKFRPFDLRMPMVYISQSSSAKHIGNRQGEEACGLLYLAHILETDINGHCIAELLQPVGRAGNLDDELKAILFHNGLRDVVPFEERFIEMYAQPAQPVTDQDLKNRRDMRKSCVFTIDPLTARDLDDALSIEQLSENLYEVGVHISDVSHYLQEDSELDNIVKDRSTSIYMANEVIHMLPQSLCFRCSLLPGEDKYSFSVFWRMDGNGNQLDKPTFTRSVINSCTQFAYEHAQKIIDNPHERFTDDDFPTILNGFTVQDVVKRVSWLNSVASNMREKRFDNGALTINNAKVRFTLDPISGEPLGFEVEKQREANHMIEEFMLLANQAVARFIHDAYPDIAVLRNHPPPLTKSLKALREKLLSQGYDLDYSSSKALQESMKRLCSQAADPVAMTACLGQLLMKPMARANYFCSEGKTDPSQLSHYALSIPIYTHFTSPIRRYPDVMVHRLLAAGLNYCPAPGRSCDELHQLTKIANERKYNAKLAGDDSGNLFFKRYVSNRQAIYMRAVVMEIFQHMMNVVTVESGHVICINYKKQRVLIDTHNTPNFLLVADRNMKQTPYKLQLLSVVAIRLIIWDGKLTGFLLTGEQRQKGPIMELPGTVRQDNKFKEQQQQQQQQQLPAKNNSNNKSAKTAQQRSQEQQQYQQQQQQRQRQQQQQRLFALRKTSS